jgi:hypothetical protein
MSTGVASQILSHQVELLLKSVKEFNQSIRGILHAPNFEF